MIIQDCHLHTNFSDGENSPREMVIKSIELGYNKIAITDHVNAHSNWLDEYISAIAMLKTEFKNHIEILCGVETKIIDLDGNIDVNGKYIESFDVILAAIHRVPSGSNQYIPPSQFEVNKSNAFKLYSTAIERVMYNRFVTVIAHPFSLFRNFPEFITVEFLSWLSNLADKCDKYIEFNTKKHCSFVPKIWWKDVKKVWVGSDSHSVQDMVCEYPNIYKFINYYNKNRGMYYE